MVFYLSHTKDENGRKKHTERWRERLSRRELTRPDSSAKRARDGLIQLPSQSAFEFFNSHA